LLATALFISSTVLAVMAPSGITTNSVYAFLFVLVNFAGYTFIYNRTRRKNRKIPAKVVSAITVMLSAGFTALTALTFSDYLPLDRSRALIAYAVIFLLTALMLQPEEIVDRLN